MQADVAPVWHQAEKAKQSVAMAYSTVQRSMQAEQDVRQRLQQVGRQAGRPGQGTRGLRGRRLTGSTPLPRV